MKYLKQFVIGSSYLVFVPFLYLLNKYEKSGFLNYGLNNYGLLAPLWWGMWNIISLILAEIFNLSLKMRFLIISIISAVTILIYARTMKVYNFTNETQWFNYYIFIIVSYLIIWNIIVYNIEKHI